MLALERRTILAQSPALLAKLSASSSAAPFTAPSLGPRYERAVGLTDGVRDGAADGPADADKDDEAVDKQLRGVHTRKDVNIDVGCYIFPCRSTVVSGMDID